jgi:hypothetical protein
MLIAKLASGVLLFVLGRRFGFSRLGAAAATLLFGLCPLAVIYTRWTFLDNLVTPWLLLAFVLAYSRRRSIWAGTGAALAFATAVLTKETALVLLPAFAWAFAQNLDRRNRAHVVAVAATSGLLLASLYPLYALYKGELFPGKGHNSLLGTAQWQLAGRQSSGSLLDAGSPMRHLFDTWLGYDRYLILAGLVAIPLTMCVRRLRPVAVALAAGWLLMVRGGYVPFMHVISLLPWSALAVVGVLEAVAGRRPVVGPGWLRLRDTSHWSAPVRVALVGALTTCLLGTAAAYWPPKLRTMMEHHQEQPLAEATRWAADNIPRGKVLVVHDAIWTDLVQQYGFNPRPIIVYKLDTDPAVRRSLRRIDYLILPNWYYTTPDAAQKYPTAQQAREHAVVIASFGSGSNGVQIYRVSRYWSPSP